LKEQKYGEIRENDVAGKKRSTDSNREGEGAGGERRRRK